MAREAKDPNAGKRDLTLGDGNNRFSIDMSQLRGLGRGATQGKSEQQEYLDDLYEKVKKRQEEAEANGEED